MVRSFQIFLVFTIVCVAATIAVGQVSSSGMYEFTSVSIGHDASNGWQSLLNPAVGYSFDRNFAVESGVPFYVVTTTNSTTTSGTTTSGTRSNVLGDAFIRMRAAKASETFNYSGALTATAPTGDTSAGVSTGRATVTFENHLDRSFGRITPFGEASIGNSLGSSKHYQRSYTTLGAASEFRGGIGLDLLKNVSFETSFYGDVGYGNQKVYSRQVGKGATGAAKSSHGRPFETSYLTTGDASVIDDHGLTADLSFSPAPRYGVDLAYNRSIPYGLDSVAVTVGVRLGHLNNTAKK